MIGIQAEQRFVHRDRLLILNRRQVFIECRPGRLTEHLVVAPQDEIPLALAHARRQLHRSFGRRQVLGGQPQLLGKVPIGVRLSIRVTDPNLCTENDTTPDATRNVFANDVQLVDVVAIPAQGDTRAGTGLAFTVGADGGVTP